MMAIRGTEREIRYMDRSVPAAIGIRPGEILFACDEGVDRRVPEKIESLCKAHGFSGYRIAEFGRDPAWGFQLANVTYNAVREARFDRVLIADVDYSLREAVMAGYGIVGRGGVAVCSFTKRYLVRNLPDLVRYAFYRWNVRNNDYVFTGLHWVWRPYYLADVDREGFMRIKNGIDTYLADSVRRRGIHGIVTRKEEGCDCHDYASEDYDWAQFQLGVWLGANRMLVWRLPRSVRRAGAALPGRARRFCKNRAYPLLYVLLVSCLYCHPYVLRGYVWARRNPGHGVVRAASGKTREEWRYMGAELIRPLRRWKSTDRIGF